MGKKVRYVFPMLLLSSSALAQHTGLAVWSKIHDVFSHPRCANCHVGPDNVPIWSGSSYGAKARPHGMNINAGTSRSGTESIACNACHSEHNVPLPHGPPGAHGWRLAPVTMQWFGKSSAEICAQIKDPTRNGNKLTIAEVAEHIKDDDPLVLWGWDPGPGREPAPYSKDQLITFLENWDKAGAPCPTR
jgi:hypothetical protein